MSTRTLHQRIEIWEQGLDRLALHIDRLGDQGEKLLPLYERVEKLLASDQQKISTLSSVSQRLKRLKGETATQSLPTHHAET